VKDIINYIQSDKDLSKKIVTLDFENKLEYVTPYMFAVLKFQFKLAEFILTTNKANKYYKNRNEEHVYRMARRLNLKHVMKYIILSEKGEWVHDQNTSIMSTQIYKQGGGGSSSNNNDKSMRINLNLPLSSNSSQYPI
jgi:uncharacterized membrane protein YcgQ (UPF0703/DUF1980 family)